jgi:hypothetical protein
MSEGKFSEFPLIETTVVHHLNNINEMLTSGNIDEFYHNNQIMYKCY